MGLYFPLFLNIGTSFAVCQSRGNVDVSNDLSKMSAANGSARIFAKSCRILSTILSGRGALRILRFCSCFKIPGTVILNLFIKGKGIGPRSGRLSCVPELNTDLNWSFNASAF